MQVYANFDHHLQNSRGEYNGYEIAPAPECPARFDAIIDGMQKAGFAPPLQPESSDFPVHPARIHDPGLIDFLQTAHDQWRILHDGLRDNQIGDAIPGTMPPRSRMGPPPQRIDAALGFWCNDTCTPIQSGTWQAVHGSVMTAISGANYLFHSRKNSFSLCRPPGHHAGRATYGGFCFLNNAAIAAQQLRDLGMDRIALLDVDYHHGNGSQDIFYDRDDVLLVSIHADPAFDYPYYAGFAEECGTGKGIGYNLNLPLPLWTTWGQYQPALQQALDRILAFKPDGVVISFGADTFNGDPIGKFRLNSDDFWAIGNMIAGLGMPVLIIMEGGYAIRDLGHNVVQFLDGIISSEK